MPSPYRHNVLVDANVWYSRTLRDWLALIYLNDLSDIYQVHYTTDILVEFLYHLRKNHPDWDGAKIDKARDHIEHIFVDGRVHDFVVDGSFKGSDPHDAHIHAAAVACGADVILTCNTKDFLPADVDPTDLPYEVWHPDDFFILVDDSAPDVVRDVTKSQFEYWSGRNPDVDLATHLRVAGAPQFADRIRSHLVALNYIFDAGSS